MVVDINWECFFTPKFTPGFSATQGWYQPWYLADLNLGGANDTLPATYQYIPGQDWSDRSKDLIPYAEITHTLRFGSTAQIIMDVCSDRDIFEISDNEVTTGDPPVHIGHMLQRMSFPYRVHKINLQAKNDITMPTGQFVGHMIDTSIQQMSDVQDSNQDGRWRIEQNFVSFDHPRGLLGRGRGAPLWHHRANNTTDNYHLSFRSSDNLTFDSAITRSVAWMNMSRPTLDFPVTFSYSEKGVAPYNRTIGSDPMSITGTVTFTNASSAVSGVGSTFLTELQVGQKIRFDADGLYFFISSITNDTNLVLTANYTGTGGAGAASKIPITDVVTVDGRSPWEILERLLGYMGAVEAENKKYIPTCSITGVINTTHGGYDKTAAVNEDFRTTQGMQKNTSTDMTTRFNLISVPFFVGGSPGNNNNEYWIKFTLYKSDGAGGWIIVKTIPNTGYEYVPGPDPAIWRNSVPAHGRKYYKFPTQEITPEDTYKWDVDLVTGGSFTIGTTGGMAYSPQTYNFLNSPLRMDYSKINSFIVTRGACYEYGQYDAGFAVGKSPYGCKDGVAFCTDSGAWGGCYPDPDASPAEAVSAIYGIQGTYAKVNTLSNKANWNTVCRLHSKKLYSCHLNIDGTYREPITGSIVFNDGFTTNLVGGYIEVYSPEIDDMVIQRIIEQKNIVANNRLTTVMKVFRI